MELCSSIQNSLSPVRKFQICNVSGFLWSLCILARVYILSDQEWLAHLDAEKPNPSRSRLPVYGFQCFSFGWLVQKQQALHKILRRFYSPFTKLVAIKMVIHYFWHIRLRNHPYRKIAYYYLKLQRLKKKHAKLLQRTRASHWKSMPDFEVYSLITKGMPGIYFMFGMKMFQYLRSQRNFTLFTCDKVSCAPDWPLTSLCIWGWTKLVPWSDLGLGVCATMPGLCSAGNWAQGFRD